MLTKLLKKKASTLYLIRMNSPPDYSEFEISIFGPGCGESIVVHTGSNKWMIIDSCRGKDGMPAPVSYLTSIGVDLSKDVVAVVASHWHDDHTAGLSKIFQQCKSSKLICAQAMTTEEFLTAMECYSRSAELCDSGVTEMCKVLDIALKEKRTITRACNNKLVYQNSDAFECRVFSLSPSDHANEIAMSRFAKTICEMGGKRRAAALNPNHCSIVLRIQAGDSYFLLGSDMESGDKLKGWTAILDNPLDEEKSALIKVPHHGSVTGHSNDVWADMLHPHPSALIAPFIKGRHNLPTSIDIDRITDLTDYAYITSHPNPPKKVIKRKKVDKSIKESFVNLHIEHVSSGHVRYRFQPNDKTSSLELFGGAMHLRELL